MVPSSAPRATCHPRITAAASPPSLRRRTTRSSGNVSAICAAISQVRSGLSSSTTMTSYSPGSAASRFLRTAAKKSAIFSLSFFVGTTRESNTSLWAGSSAGTTNGPVGASIIGAPSRLVGGAAKLLYCIRLPFRDHLERNREAAAVRDRHALAFALQRAHEIRISPGELRHILPGVQAIFPRRQAGHTKVTVLVGGRPAIQLRPLLVFGHQHHSGARFHGAFHRAGVRADQHIECGRAAC